MKIIGSTTEGFILSAGADEVANLIGYFGRYDLERTEHRALKIGDEITVHAMYRRLHTLASRRGEIKTAQKMLRDAASELELVDPILEASNNEKVEG